MFTNLWCMHSVTVYSWIKMKAWNQTNQPVSLVYATIIAAVKRCSHAVVVLAAALALPVVVAVPVPGVAGAGKAAGVAATAFLTLPWTIVCGRDDDYNLERRVLICFRQRGLTEFLFI